MTRIFEAADNMTVYNGLNKLTPLQFPILLRMLYGCGLRLGEALSLKVSEVDFDDGVIFIRNAKGNKDRLVPMDESLTRICRSYRKLMQSKFSKHDALFFMNKDGKQYSHTWPQKLFRKVLVRAGIERPNLELHRRNICLHCLRHAFAVNSFKNQDDSGMDSYAYSPLLSIYLGHTHFYRTEVYLHMTEEIQKSIVDKTSAYTKGIFPEVPSL
jgi:integrase